MRVFLLALLAALSGPALGALAAVADTSTGVIELYDDAGPCVGEAKYAVFIGTDGGKIPGCWVARNEMVYIAFMDADIARVRQSSFRKPAEG